MSNEELIKQIEDILTLFSVKEITRCNFKPHPYTIGTKHVVYASDHFGGFLSKESIIKGEKDAKIRCGSPRCRLSYKDHTSDNVLFLTLKRDVTKDEATSEILQIKHLLENNDVDGIAFVDTPNEFRIV